MIPFVGKQYGSRNKKLLILAESHYPPYTIDGASWYAGNSDELSCEDHLWTNTAMITNNAGQNSKSGRIYRNMQHAICPRDNFHKDFLAKIAYMNFFQRPADSTVASIDVTPQDVKVANETLPRVLDVLKPDCIFFISEKSYNAVDKTIFSQKPMGYCPHPCRIWWNKKAVKYGNLNGKELFIKFMQDNKIF